VTQRDPLTRGQVVLLGALTLLLYLGMEWLFLVTKSSFTGMLSPFERVSLLSASFLLMAAILLPCLLLVAVVSTRAAMVPVALLLGSLFFLMADNFLYTVLNLGTLNSPRALRVGYTLLFLAFCWLAHRQLSKARPPRAGLLLALLGALLVVFLVSVPSRLADAAEIRAGLEVAAAESTTGPRPNIVLLGLDGTEAAALSLYGKPYDTSPFLRSIADELLIFDNAFPDSGKTTGSLTALLTGRSPLETRVGFPPQVLLGAKSFLHLPALLNRFGYEGFQHTIRYYADAGDLNFKDAFVQANGRTVPLRWLDRTLVQRWFNNEIFFLETLYERLAKRLRYISFRGDMLNLYHLVQANQGLGYSRDLAAVEDFERFLAQQRNPFYAHLHLMSTHCCAHNPTSRAFTAAGVRSQSQRAGIQAASRMNAIRDMDALVERLYRALEASDVLENTIFILYSDHSYRWDSVRSVPLVVRFPNRAHAGHSQGNAQLSMVPAMVLEQLGVSPPAWMQPAPELEEDTTRLAAPGAPIFGLRSFKYRRYKIGTGGLSMMTDPGPPNYGIAELFMVICSRRYTASLRDGRILIGKIEGHEAACPEESYPDQVRVQELFQEVMDRHGLVWERVVGRPRQ